MKTKEQLREEAHKLIRERLAQAGVKSPEQLAKEINKHNVESAKLSQRIKEALKP